MRGANEGRFPVRPCASMRAFKERRYPDWLARALRSSGHPGTFYTKMHALNSTHDRHIHK